jgi:predicted dehydrogenase
VKRVLGVGLIGCGHAAQMHLAAMRSGLRARVVAAADVDAAAVERLVRGTGVQPFADYRLLLSAPGVDAVAVLTPPAVQLEIALAALAAGKHVLVERPMTRSLEEADRLISEAAAAGHALMVGFHLRFHRHVRAARRAIETGALGPIRFLHGVLSTTNDRGRRFPAYRARRALGGGALVDLAVAHFDLWRHLLGEEVEEVSALSVAGAADDGTAGVVGRLTSGALAAAVFSEEAAEQNLIALHGARGRLELSLYRADGFARADSGTFPGDPGRRLATLGRAAKGLPGLIRARRAGGVYLESYRSQWQHFAAAILTGHPPAPTARDGRRALAIALAAAESADRGRAVRVPG